MKRLLILMVTSVMVAVVLAGGWACAPKPPGTLDIGIAIPLTGPAAHVGENTQNGALLAIDDQNAEGGVTIAGQKYMINPIIRDTKMDVAVGKAVAEELVFDKGCKVICGPLAGDGIGVQAVTEPNKVILIATGLMAPEMGTADKLYTFFPAGEARMFCVNGYAYIQQVYPEAKTVMAMAPDTPVAKGWAGGCEEMTARYGLNCLGLELYPISTTDFMPVISRVLAKKPDIINTLSAGGDTGPLCALLVKQLREAGFDGIIYLPSFPPLAVLKETVPKESLTRVITNDVDLESPLVPDVWRDLHHRYMEKYGEPAIDIAWEEYNGVKPFFESIDGLDTMDTTAWLEAFVKYRWDGVWGYESYWVGDALTGINRLLFRSFLISEWTNGELETKWEAPIPLDVFVK